MDATATDVGARAPKLTDASRLRRPRVPTSVVVAVLGLVLGSWLLPAFTRQWDDRQKAGDVRATVMAEISSTTGRAILDLREASRTPVAARSPGTNAPPEALEWAIANLEIRARLHAYFGAGAVEHWALVSQYVASMMSIAYGGPDGPAAVPNPWISRMRSPQLERLFGRLMAGAEVLPTLEIAILSETETLTKRLLRMHVNGYSTTTRDLVADLFPS